MCGTALHRGDSGVVTDNQWGLEDTAEGDAITSCDAREHGFDLVGVDIVEESIVEGGTLGLHGIKMLESLSYCSPD